MKEVEFIVVGLGIAGVSFCERLLGSKKEFVALDGPKMAATAVAGGIVNPVVLKRFTPVWNAALFLEEAIPFYQTIQSRLQIDFFRETEILRVFSNVQEQNEWSVASSSHKLKDFLNPELLSNNGPELNAPYGLGAMQTALLLNTLRLLEAYRSFLKDRVVQEEFRYEEVVMKEDAIAYKNIRAKHLVFAEGASVINNPFFQVEGLIPKKGEYITIRSENLNIDKVVKGPFFLIPLGDHLYKVGATFAHGDMTYENTEKGREQLTDAVAKMIHGPFEVVDQVAGMRPTVKDRKPLLGSISDKKIQFFNGLGTRGLLMAPLLSKLLLDHIETGTDLPSEMDIKRFSSGRT
ncbi:MAG: FAD-binding oxidoreductase [Flavobacteriaceae bacterium]|nr:FAD-binding oxidoreductase [Flavobacteriaceae bacterium]